MGNALQNRNMRHLLASTLPHQDLQHVAQAPPVVCRHLLMITVEYRTNRNVLAMVMPNGNHFSGFVHVVNSLLVRVMYASRKRVLDFNLKTFSTPLLGNVLWPRTSSQLPWLVHSRLEWLRWYRRINLPIAQMQR